MKNLRHYLALILCTLTLLAVRAQHSMEITHYGPEEGLTQASIPQILQDARGYIWFASWDGLIRFDGYQFKTYKGRPGDGNQLPSNRFTHIEEDTRGNLWCRVGRDAILFDIRKEHFIDVLAEAGLNNASGRQLGETYPLDNGTVWLSYDTGELFRVTAEKTLSKAVKQFLPQGQGNFVAAVIQVVSDSRGREWLMTEKESFVIDGEEVRSIGNASAVAEWEGLMYVGYRDGRLTYYNEQMRRSEAVYLSEVPRDISSLTPLGRSRMLITSKTDGAYLYNRNDKSTKKIDFSVLGREEVGLLRAYVDSRGEVWFEPTTRGVIHYMPQSGKVEWLGREVRLPIVDRGRFPMFEIHEDTYGRIWVLLQDRNLRMYDSATGEFKTLFEVMGRPQPAVADPTVRGFLIDRQGNLWANTVLRGVEKISFFDINYSFSPIADAIDVRAFLNDRYGRTWIASKDDRIRIYNREQKMLGYLSGTGGVSAELPIRIRAYALCEDSEGSVWIGTKSEGVYRLRPRGDDASDGYAISHYVSDPKEPSSLSGNSIYAIIEDSKRRIWVGSYGGGMNCVVKGADGEVTFRNHRVGLTDYPLGYAPRVRCLREVREGLFFVGTTEGLVVYDERSSRSNKFSFFKRDALRRNSLSSNDVMDIFVSSAGDIYLATYGGGVDRVELRNEADRSDLTFHSISVSDGLESDQALSVTEDKEGALWIVSDNALSRYYPATGEIENFTVAYFRKRFNFSEGHPLVLASGELLFGNDCGYLTVDVNRMKKSAFVPSIGLTGLRIHGDDERVGGMNIEFAEQLELKPHQRNITIHFAALDYVSSRDIRYAYRLRGLEENWNSADESHSAIYTNLSKGRYLFEVRSSNSDGEWTDNVRTLEVVVRPRFGETVWATLLIIVLLLGAIVSGLYVYLMIYKLRHQVVIEEQLTQLKLQFFTDISHELRTPLTLISSPLEEVMDHEQLSEKGRRNLATVRRNTQRLLVLINQILDFRKIQNRRMRLAVEPTDVVQLARSLMENFIVMADEKGIDFSLTTSHPQITVWGDRDKIEKIIINLLSNAFKYTPRGKTIVLEVADTEHHVRITISDEGMGLNKKQLETLFERFEAFLKTNSTLPSTGIGLSLVKNLVDLHHGTIDVVSEEGAGSRFTVTLPKGCCHFENDPNISFVASAVPKEAEQVQSEEGACVQEEGKPDTTLLIVEDNEELRQFLSDTLAMTYRVIEAENGAVGLAKARAELPEIILSDVMMPEMDGLEMVKHIKADSTLCHIPIVLLSAKSSLDDRIRGLEAGIDDYITKPFSAGYLKVRLQNLLARREEMKLLMRERMADVQSLGADEQALLLAPEQPQIESHDKVFVKNLMETMEREMDNVDLNVDDLAYALAMSRTVFYKKLKMLTGYAPVDFIRSIRIRRAAQLIESGELTVAEVAFRTGFNDPKYFSKCFKKELGQTPTEYKGAVR